MLTMSRVSGILVACALFGASGCGGSGSGGPAGPSSSTYAGAWSGSADEKALSFTVTPGGEVTSLSVVRTWIYLVSAGGGAATAVLCPVTMVSSGSARINGTSFEITVSGNGASTVVKGTFSSASAAAGTVEPFSISRGCQNESILGDGSQNSRSWQATKR